MFLDSKYFKMRYWKFSHPSRSQSIFTVSHLINLQKYHNLATASNTQPERQTKRGVSFLLELLSIYGVLLEQRNCLTSVPARNDTQVLRSKFLLAQHMPSLHGRKEQQSWFPCGCFFTWADDSVVAASIRSEAWPKHKNPEFCQLKKEKWQKKTGTNN